MADTEAEYILHADGRIRPNTLCDGVEERYRAAAAERGQMRRSHAALTLAQVFRVHPWLAEIRLTITVSFEYDDSGGYYRTMSLRAEVIGKVLSVPLREDDFTDGEWDNDSAQNLVESMLEDDSYDLYEALSPEASRNEDLTLYLERERIAPLLTQERVSGAAVLAALLTVSDGAPQHASSA